MKELPDNLRFQSPHPFDSKDIDEITPVTLSSSRRGWLTIENPDGKVRTDTEEQLVSFMKSARYKFTYAMPEDLTCLLKSLTENQLFRYQRIGKTPLGSGVLFRNRNGMRYQEGSKHWFIWNLIGFIKYQGLEKLNPKNLDHLSIIAKTLIGNNSRFGIPNYTFGSVASNARAYILQFDNILRELQKIFKWSKTHKDMLNDFYASTINAPQLSDGIGSEDLESWDMVTSHLNILEYMPSVLDCDIFQDMPYTEKAAYGTYEIEFNIPPHRFYFPPVPSIVEEKVPNPELLLIPAISRKVVYRDGPIKGIYAKPILDMLTYLKIPFKVLKSWQLIPNGELRYPYKEFCSKTRKIIEVPTQLVNNKPLYQTVWGSMLFIYDSMDEETGELYYEAGGTFNPIVASHIIATQWCYVWWQSYVNEGYVKAIRSDAISASEFSPAKCPFLPNSEHYSITLRTKGLHTFLTPYLKAFPDPDKPGQYGKGKIWAEMIDRFRDGRKIELEYTTRVPLNDTSFDPRYMGNEVTAAKDIPWSYGHGRVGPEIARLGKLFDGWSQSTLSPNSLDEALRDLNWLSDYLELSYKVAKL